MAKKINRPKIGGVDPEAKIPRPKANPIAVKPSEPHPLEVTAKDRQLFRELPKADKDLPQEQKISVRVEAQPVPGMTLDQLEEEMKKIGNKVVGRDDERNVLILHLQEGY